MDKDQQYQKTKQQMLSYLRHRVMPILQPLQVDLLTHRPADINEFSLLWLQNFREQRNHVGEVSSDEEQPDEVFQQRVNQRKKARRERGGREGISGEVYSAIKASELKKSYWNKCEEDKINILIKLRNHIFFKNLSEKNIEQIIRCMKPVTYRPGEIVIRQGEAGDQLFLVGSGELRCVVQSKKQQKVYTEGEAFGELALLYNTKRASTITAITEAKLFSLNRASFNSILRNDVLKKTRICQQILDKNELFSTMTPYQKCKLIESAKQMWVPAGKYIIKEGQIGDRFYIVGEGKLVAEKSEGEETKFVYYFKEGDYFGEVSLLRNVPRQASVKTLTTSKLLYIERSTFKRLLGPIQQLLRRNQQRYREIKSSVKQNII